MVKKPRFNESTSKKNLLKQRLLRVAGVFALVLTVCGGAYLLIQSFEASERKKLEDVKSAISKANSELDELERQFSVIIDHFADYKVIYKKISEGKLTLSVRKAKRALDRLRRRHRLQDLQVEITSLETWGENKRGLDQFIGFRPTYRRIKLDFSAISDLQAYAFVNSIRDNFPGYIHMEKLGIKQSQEYDDEFLESIGTDEPLPLVSTELKILWGGVQEMADKEGGDE